jgi:hypothetical protein
MIVNKIYSGKKLFDFTEFLRYLGEFFVKTFFVKKFSTLTDTTLTDIQPAATCIIQALQNIFNCVKLY